MAGELVEEYTENLECGERIGVATRRYCGHLQGLSCYSIHIIKLNMSDPHFLFAVPICPYAPIMGCSSAITARDYSPSDGISRAGDQAENLP